MATKETNNRQKLLLRISISLLFLLFGIGIVVAFHNLLSGSKINPFQFDNGNYIIPK